MKLYFITGNQSKLKEFKDIIPDIEQLDIDLPEIQEINAKTIIKDKLLRALKHAKGEIIVEDTSLHLDALNGLPGPLIKWFVPTLGTEGIVDITERFSKNKAQVKTLIGYAKNRDELHFFEGVVEGSIVRARGPAKFYFDPIFLPNGHDKTFAEMSLEEKNAISHRSQAINKLKDFLKEQ